MRSGFGRKVVALRDQNGMTQKQFSDATGWSQSRISNVEHQNSPISDDVLRVYLSVLAPSGSAALELRKLASFSNEVRKAKRDNVSHPPIVAMFKGFGKNLSPNAFAKIQDIIERETGENVSALNFSNTSISAKKGSKKSRRPDLSNERFVELCITAARFRRRFANETEKLDLDKVLTRLVVDDQRFDFRIAEILPAIAEGSFACIVGEAKGHILIVEETRYLSAIAGVYFARHVIAHELAHHVLHADELISDGELLFAPQTLAKNTSQMIGNNQSIDQVVDSLVEVEAECFATFLLALWEAFMKGTDPKYLEKDFGEQLGEIKRYLPYFKQDAVVTEFKRQLWQLGENSHPIFHH